MITIEHAERTPEHRPCLAVTLSQWVIHEGLRVIEVSLPNKFELRYAATLDDEWYGPVAYQDPCASITKRTLVFIKRETKVLGTLDLSHQYWVPGLFTKASGRLIL